MEVDPPEFRLVSWILDNASRTEYDLSSSGLKEPELEEMGISTSYGAYLQEEADHERALAETVADLYRVEAENVVVTTGGSEAIYLAFSVFGNGRAVVPLPNYEPMFTVPRWLGMNVSHALKPPVVPGAVYGVTDPNNPTGSRLARGALEFLASASKKATVYVNETYGGFTFRRPSTLFAEEERVVTSSSMTKFYGLGRLRVGWMTANRPRARLLRKGRRLTSGHTSEYSLWIAKQVLSKREAFVGRARRLHAENLELVRKFSESAPGIKVLLPEAAPFCLVRYEKGPDSVTFAERLLKKEGVLVSPGDYFGAPKAFRLCFTAGRDELAAGLERLASFLGS